MTYGSQIWGQYIDRHNENIFKLQNRAIRTINFSDFNANVNPIYKSMNILKLKDLVTLQNIMFVHDYFNENTPHCFNSYFTRIRDIHEITTKNSHLGCLFTTFATTTKYGLNSITRKCLLNWNEMTNDLKTNLSSIPRPLIKKKIKKQLINNY